MDIQEALRKSRDTVCIPQRGATCLGYGGIKCDRECSRYFPGLARRQAEHEDYLRRKIQELKLQSGIVIRISHNPEIPGEVILEKGEYINDGNDVPIFTCFQRDVLSFDAIQAVLSCSSLQLK